MSSKYRISVPFSPKYFGISAFESPWDLLCIFAFYEHPRALHEHLWQVEISQCMRKVHQNADFGHKFHHIVDAREMLADAHKLQKMQSRGQELSNALILKNF